MAVKSSSSLITFRQPAMISSIPRFRTVNLRTAHFPLRRTLTAQIKSSIRDLVFEDQSNGIVCYRDASGEIICEGLDEGPCLRQFPLSPYLRRDAEMIELLQQKWLRMVESGGGAGNGGIPMVKDSNYNGFNTMC